MKHVMVDLETFGRKSGCAIAAIGAVAFEEEGPLGDNFYRAISEPVGTVDMSTIKWWLNQDDAVRKVLMSKDAVPHEQALSEFYQFFRDQGARYLWCYGAGFDEPILRGAAGGLAVPWDYKDVRCARTLAMVAGVQVAHWADHHDALGDATRQAEQVVRCLWRVRAAKLQDAEDSKKKKGRSK